MFEDQNPVYPRMSTPSPVILRVWEDDYGVPSVDPESLQLMTLFKIHPVNAIVQQAYCPQWLDIPSIQINDIFIARGPDLMMHAVNICQSPMDLTLNERIRYRLAAYKKYFMECFADAFYFDCWLNKANYEHAIKGWYSNVIPFPFNYLYLKKMRDLAKERFRALVGSRDLDKFILRQNKCTEHCLQDFASLLKDGRRYFFGDTPSSLDVVIYSYLAVALHIPLPDPHLQNLVKNHPALVRFVKNMTAKYFPDTPIQYKYVEPVNTNSDRASTKSLVIAGLFATMAMFLYAYSIGLIDKLHFKGVVQIRNKIL